jgi:dUTP pyrophosphatase
MNQSKPTIELKILDDRLHELGIPTHQTAQSAGIDLIACIAEPIEIHPQAPAILIPTGMAMHMDSDEYFAMIAPRSGLGHKAGLILGNTVGVIDSDYQNQVFVSAWNRNPSGAPITIKPGDRIAQMIFLPVIRPVMKIVGDFSANSARGMGGFGSTGK